LQAANIVHASGESSPRVPSGCIAVALHADGAAHVACLAARLEEHDIHHVVVVEGEGRYRGQRMAIGIEPTEDRDLVRKVVGALPLVK